MPPLAQSEGGASLSVRHLVKSFATPSGGTGRDGNAYALAGVSFDVGKGEFFTLLGPSGCGKTTLLQCIAGLEIPDDGEIVMDGETVYSRKKGIFLAASRRDLGMVFQSYAVWPHMTVFENVAFPLRYGSRKTKPAELRERVMRSLELVRLDALADRPSPYLSGGQQQRIALARALVHEPRIVLLDEPLSNLDAKLRDEMRIELRELSKSLGLTFIYVTHDQVEALSMSDRLALMRGGQIVQQGTPRDVFLRPASAFVADFMGGSNIVMGKLLPGGIAVETSFGVVRCAAPADLPRGGRVLLLIRPHAVRVRRAPNEAVPGENAFSGSVTALTFVGERIDAKIQLEGCLLRASLDTYDEITVGDRVLVELPPGRCTVSLPEPEAGDAVIA